MIFERRKISLPMSKQTIKFILFLGILVSLWMLSRVVAIDFDGYREFLLRLPLLLSGLFFVGLYVGLTLLIVFGPKDFFRITGAVIFGPYLSTLFVWAAEMVNVVILFHLSRKLGRGFVEEKFKIRQKDLDGLGTRAGFWTVLALRMNPIVSFRLMDLGFGLTQISFRKYFFIALLGSPTRIFWLQFILAGTGTAFLKNPRALIEYLLNNKSAFYFNLVYLLCVLILTVVAVLIRGRGQKKVGPNQAPEIRSG